MSICWMWHASWTVSNMAETLPFYTEVLGLEIVHSQIQDNDYTRQLVGVPGAVLHAVLLKVPGAPSGPSGHMIELVEYIQAKGQKLDTTPSNTGSGHFAFATRDIHGMYNKLKAAGTTFVSAPVAISAGINEGGFTCYFKDPDGYTLELMQPPEWRFAPAG